MKKKTKIEKKNKKKKNKVIRPKSRASALSKKVRQTDRQTFLKKTFKITVDCTNFPLHHSDTTNTLKSL